MISQRDLGKIIIGISLLLFIILVLVKIDTDKKDVFLCEEIGADPALEMADCPAHKSISSWLLSLSFGIVFLMVGAGIYLLFQKDREKEFKKIDTSKLDEKERQIYELLKQNNGSLYQSDVVKETGLSKVQTTRVLDRMASKDIIGRQRRGMTNIVILK
ncbi:TPA: hypothetical protein HA239_01575 [Candidatus Woesearchaeota archaeon]|nr:hypothetical protein QT06_C0001G0915 [archaeon GW2011_AR15]MBS3104602.1 hypothetical protein [Candidatus Woesearchaeota archaeon]HIH41083.1 hypothetical protein [Candidatus Woesearchaeota archaeon]